MHNWKKIITLYSEEIVDMILSISYYQAPEPNGRYYQKHVQHIAPYLDKVYNHADYLEKVPHEMLIWTNRHSRVTNNVLYRCWEWEEMGVPNLQRYYL